MLGPCFFSVCPPSDSDHRSSTPVVDRPWPPSNPSGHGRCERDEEERKRRRRRKRRKNHRRKKKTRRQQREKMRQRQQFLAVCESSLQLHVLPFPLPPSASSSFVSLLPRSSSL